MHSVMKYLLFGLSVNGIDPRKRNWFHKILMVFNCISVVAVYFINMMELLLNWHGVETFGDVHLISSTLIMALKFVYLMINQSKLVHLIDTVANFWTYDKFDPSTNKRISAILDRTMYATKIFGLSVLGTAFSMIISGLIEREIIFPGYDICNLENNTCYWLHMSWQLYFCFVELLPTVLGFDGLFVCFIAYAYCDIEMIKVALKQLTLVIMKNHLPVEFREESPKEKKLVHDNLKDIVDEHSQVMQFIKELNIFYSPMMLLHSGSSFFSLIFCLYMITLDGVPPKIDVAAKYGILLFAVCFQYLIFCYSGTIILEQSKTLEYHFYDTDWWYKTQPDFRRSIMLMIERAQSTPKLKIGNMNDLNLESYLSVIRNGLSAVTLMRTMANSDKI